MTPYLTPPLPPLSTWTRPLTYLPDPLPSLPPLSTWMRTASLRRSTASSSTAGRTTTRRRRGTRTARGWSLAAPFASCCWTGCSRLRPTACASVPTTSTARRARATRSSSRRLQSVSDASPQRGPQHGSQCEPQRGPQHGLVSDTCRRPPVRAPSARPSFRFTVFLFRGRFWRVSSVEIVPKEVTKWCLNFRNYFHYNARSHARINACPT